MSDSGQAPPHFDRYTPPRVGDKRRVTYTVHAGRTFTLEEDHVSYGKKGDVLTLNRTGTMEATEEFVFSNKGFNNRWVLTEWHLESYTSSLTLWERLKAWLTSPAVKRSSLPEAKIHKVGL